MGNAATTSISQSTNADGFNGIALISQNFDSVNSGIAEAISGDNVASGNESINVARSRQGAFTSGTVGANTANSTNDSDGLAIILTGDASATGNTAQTAGSQIANAKPGPTPGIALIDQTADVRSFGNARAVSGGNTAFGNASTNLASAVQGTASARGPPLPAAVNLSNVTNSSNGTAQIDTGTATATGNEANTSITQEDEAPDTLPNVVESEASVSNRGIGFAGSGGNFAVGNASTNTALASQGAAGGSVAANLAEALSRSNGTATITTGWSDALGNKATTVTDDGTVVNRGIARAVSGANRAIGNFSGNTAENVQRASAARIATNLASGRNKSDGTATITTGSASALGNDAMTEGAGTVINRGVADAISGNNSATGNGSSNTAFNGQLAVGSFATNLASAENHSSGTALVDTGAADATGNRAVTVVSQDDEGDDDLFVHIEQDVTVINRGFATAVSGNNSATGNASSNTAETVQRAFGFRFAVNSANTVSNSTGVASILTGSATATGNIARTTADQVATVLPEAHPFALVDQTLTVRNIGDATAISGRNVGTGNGSVNTGLNDQFASAAAAIHPNVADTQNNSVGVVTVDTGTSAAVGNSTDVAGSQRTTRATA